MEAGDHEGAKVLYEEALRTTRMPITIPIATSASTDQRALGRRSAFQSFRIIAPCKIMV